jgi:hypothetical protein
MAQEADGKHQGTTPPQVRALAVASGRPAAARICLECDGATFQAVACQREGGTAWFVTWRTHCVDCGRELMIEGVEGMACPVCRALPSVRDGRNRAQPPAGSAIA